LEADLLEPQIKCGENGRRRGGQIVQDDQNPTRIAEEFPSCG